MNDGRNFLFLNLGYGRYSSVECKRCIKCKFYFIIPFNSPLQMHVTTTRANLFILISNCFFMKSLVNYSFIEFFSCCYNENNHHYHCTIMVMKCKLWQCNNCRYNMLNHHEKLQESCVYAHPQWYDF